MHGSNQPIPGGSASDGRLAVFDGDELLGIGVVENGVLKPEKVLPRELVS